MEAPLGGLTFTLALTVRHDHQLIVSSPSGTVMSNGKNLETADASFERSTCCQ